MSGQGPEPPAGGDGHNIDISVVIGTLNRAVYLERALAGLAAQSFSRDRFEVIVADNGSTDDTAGVVGRHAGEMNVIRLLEPVLGISMARNTGWRSARGRYVAFLDDDAVPDVGWLEQLFTDFATLKPAPVCVGGAVEPIWQGEKLDWIRDELLDHFSVVAHGSTVKRLENVVAGQKLVGANMAVTKEGLEAIGGFSPHLDRRGTSLLSGGDVLVQVQLDQRGLPVYYDPGLRVRHHVSAERLNPEWVASRAYWGGVSDGLMAYLLRPPTPWWALRTLSWGIRHALMSPRLLVAATGRATPETIGTKAEGLHRLGFIVGGVRALRLSLGWR